MPARHRDFPRFLTRVGRLKRLPRTGWRDRGVPAPVTESVADHSYRVAVLAWLAALDEPALDATRVLQLALIHDLAESLAGDPTPYPIDALPADPVARREFLQTWHQRDPAAAATKARREDAAMAILLADLSPASAAAVAELWTEYRAQATAAARFVKQADRLEAFLQSREYLAADPTLPMASFATEAALAITVPGLAALRDAILDSEQGDLAAAPAQDDDRSVAADAEPPPG